MSNPLSVSDGEGAGTDNNRLIFVGCEMALVHDDDLLCIDDAVCPSTICIGEAPANCASPTRGIYVIKPHLQVVESHRPVDSDVSEV